MRSERVQIASVVFVALAVVQIVLLDSARAMNRLG
jgi:hypothetical protein